MKKTKLQGLYAQHQAVYNQLLHIEAEIRDELRAEMKTYAGKDDTGYFVMLNDPDTGEPTPFRLVPDRGYFDPKQMAMVYTMTSPIGKVHRVPWKGTAIK